MGRPGLLITLLVAVLSGLAALPPVSALGQSANATGSGAAAVVTAQRMGDHGDRTRFVLEMSRERAFSILTLSDPDRIILDFPATDWRAASEGPGIGLVGRFEVGRSPDGARRVLLTMTEPVAISDAFFIPARDEGPARFVLDLVEKPAETGAWTADGGEADGTRHGSSPAADAASETASSPRTPPRAPPDIPEFPIPDRRPDVDGAGADGATDGNRSGGTVAVFESSDGSATTAPRRRIAAVAPVSRQVAADMPDLGGLPLPPIRPAVMSTADGGGPEGEGRSVRQSGPVAVDGVPFDVPMPPIRPNRPAVRTVVIDAGHGGIDPGAVGVSGTMEKTIVLRAARMLREALLDRGGYRVVLTRDSDETLRLRDRVRIARQADGDLFLSLHADSMENQNVRGASVYTLSEVASDREAEMLAARENRADALAGVVLDPTDDMVASILIDLAQRDTKNQSRLIADHLVTALGGVTRMLSNSHRQAGFAVLTAPDVPSALVELGYLSNVEDERQLSDTAHLEAMIETIAGAVDDYFRAPNLAGLARR